MSQDRINGEIVFICDDCDDALETETGYFPGANDIRLDEGWQAYPDQSIGHKNWLHRCPDCQ